MIAECLGQMYALSSVVNESESGNKRRSRISRVIIFNRFAMKIMRTLRLKTLITAVIY